MRETSVLGYHTTQIVQLMIEAMWKAESVRIVTLSIALLFSLLPSAKAVCQQPHPRVCAQFFHSDAVFTGTVISIRTEPKGEAIPGGWFYRLKVTKSPTKLDCDGPNQQHLIHCNKSNRRWKPANAASAVTALRF